MDWINIFPTHNIFFGFACDMTILDQQNTAIQKLCASHKVKTLYAFGSTVTNHFNANSDVDLVVDFEPIAVEDYADNYFDLKFSLQDILERPIDLLEA